MDRQVLTTFKIFKRFKRNPLVSDSIFRRQIYSINSVYKTRFLLFHSSQSAKHHEQLPTH